MNEKQIIEGNKLIAEFMNYGKPIIQYRFHKYWDELMPVIIKIDDIGYEVLIGRISCKITEILDNDNPIVSMVCGNVNKKIGLIYETVIKFIEWYNSK